MRSSLILFFCAILFSCTSPNKEKELRIGSAIHQILSGLNIDAEIGVECDINSLRISIDYIEKYFLLEETNKLLNSFLLYSLDSFLIEFDTVTIEREYTDFIDSFSDVYIHSNIESVKKTFVGNSLFLSIVEFLLSEIDNIDEIAFEEVNKELKELQIPGFQSNGSFWLLLLDYSNNCCDSASIEFKSMSVYKTAVDCIRPSNPSFSLAGECVGLAHAYN